MRGSITKRGTSWRLVFDVPSAEGKRKQRTMTVHGSYKGAQRELRALLSASDTVWVFGRASLHGDRHEGVAAIVRSALAQVARGS
jgi:hypothetical protein